MTADKNALVGLDAIRAAAERIEPYIVKTSIVRMTPAGLRLKAENLQPVGAFKIRGAFNAILSLNDNERERGVIAHSSGNHAQAVAYAAKKLGVKAVIVIPNNAPTIKVESTRRWGAEIHLVDFMDNARYEICAELAERHGYVLVPPFDSMTIIAGTGTIGLEILAQNPDVEAIYVPVSGGGLISGVAAAIKQSNPAIRVIGVEPEFANDAQQSFRTGQIVSVPPEQTIHTAADGLRVSQLGKVPWAHVRAWVDDIVTVSEAQIEDAMRRIATEARLIAEPSGAAAPAGALLHAAKLETTVAILSGGNVDSARYAAILAH
ncbi:MAG TPA: threonine/serine dehydratase [Rhizomicrobium sp.]|jgi:threonine dehydratase|nr:threonine/serine dehydratase [Rhizomicrobium sp.]